MRVVRLSFSFMLALFLIGVAGPAAAQPSLMVGGGISSPNGDFGDVVDSGYHGRAVLQLGVPVFPVSLRAEGAAHRFNGATAGGGHLNQLNGTIGAVLSLGGIGIGPYFFAGYGKYRQDASDLPGGAADAVTNAGYHAGFGVSAGILGFGAFGEVRFVNINTDGGDSRYVPITVGIKF